MEKRGTSLKGFFFTLLVVVLFFLMLLSLRAWMRGQQVPEELGTVRERADAMSGMMGSIAADADRMTYLAGYRALYYAAFYSGYNLTAHGSPNASIYEIMWNASLNGSPSYGVPTGTCTPGSSSCYFANQTENATMNLWWQRLQTASGRYGFTAEWRLLYFNASQSSLSTVTVSHNTSFELSDSAGVASFNRTVSFNRTINITGFEDPTHSIFTGGAAHRNITWWPYPDGYQFVISIANGSNGSNGWEYGNSTTFSGCCSIANCTDGTLDPPAVNTSTTLIVENIGPVADLCPAKANAFRGVLSNLPSGYSPELANLTVPYICGFGGSNITQLVPNGTATLLNNDGSRHEVLDVSGLRNLTGSARHYRENRNGPDFMMRLENRFNASDYGIESLMNYSIVNLTTANRSWVDYYFLNNTNCSALTCFKLKGTLNCENTTVCANDSLVHFRLDNNSVFTNGTTTTHLQYYGVENITIPN